MPLQIGLTYTTVITFGAFDRLILEMTVPNVNGQSIARGASHVAHRALKAVHVTQDVSSE